MFDEKLRRARQLIEKRDQIDEELRALFGESPQVKRTRRLMEKDNTSHHSFELEKKSDAPASEAQH